ncbi:unnamed protein product [Candida verbasci]|uniref:Carboxypeptidase n=1 Tax=Candida verbasci TaxID=1227364 RepID=A0A9W4TWC7_9ASCO|nr:unnamed protein product [Candida verbasci]
MKFNGLLSAITIASSISALSFNQHDDQIVLSNLNSEKSHSPLNEIYSQFDTVENKQFISKIWSDLSSEFSENKLIQLVNQFNNRKSLPKNNQYKAFTAASTQFETLSNDKFNDYSLRIKSTHPEILGLDTVQQYTGYLDVQSLDKHFFYWFFESRNDPKKDPIILWLNGGPGCSSSTGLFFELGPSKINSTLQPVNNPFSWNNNASVIFLDQPVGVGYSYTNSEEVVSTEAAAKDVYVFLELFFQKFPQFIQNEFHIAGESYAGHYIPRFASEIINNADRSFELSSVLIGNGITDPLIQAGSYKPMACGEGGYKPVLTPEQCHQMEKDYPKCKILTKLCYDFQNPLTCVPAQVYCDNKLFQPYAQTGLNPYDIRKKCADEGGNCYVEMDYMDDYLNLEYVKKAVGAENIDIFTSCDDTVFRNFLLNGDEQKPFQQYVAELLDHNIPVLIYAGDKDYICNWLGNFDWVNQLDYKDGEIFAKKPLKHWKTLDDGKIAGEVKNYKHFTFLRIYDAGHMVPADKASESLDMVNRWISGDYSFGHKD